MRTSYLGTEFLRLAVRPDRRRQCYFRDGDSPEVRRQTHYISTAIALDTEDTEPCQSPVPCTYSTRQDKGLKWQSRESAASWIVCKSNSPSAPPFFPICSGWGHIEERCRCTLPALVPFFTPFFHCMTHWIDLGLRRRT